MFLYLVFNFIKFEKIIIEYSEFELMVFRLPGLNMSVNELDQKVKSTLDGSKTVMEKTSGSYLDRINSFLEETENEVLKDILAEKNDEEYEVDVDLSVLPKKETCEVGENTVRSKLLP